MNIEIGKSEGKTAPPFHLKDLIVCEYKYKVIPHFIFFPKLDTAQLIAEQSVSFSDLIEKTKTWDMQSPILPYHELSMTDDLTDNNIVIRQINCAHILKRNLARRLTMKEDDGSEFDYYGDEYYWMRQSLPMRFLLFIFPALYMFQTYLLKFLLIALSYNPIKLNVVV